MSSIFDFFRGERGPRDEYETCKVVMTIPVGRSTGKPRIYLFQRRDKEKGDGKLYYTVPSGMEAKAQFGADQAAERELHWEMKINGKFKRFEVKGGVAVYSVDVDDRKIIESRKPGDWFDIDDLPPLENFFKNQGEIISDYVTSLRSGGGR